MNVKAYIQYEIRDRQGQLIDFKKQEANSLVRAFLDILYVVMYNSALANCRDVTNTLRTVDNGALTFASTAGAGDTAKSLVVGTGTGAVTITDYALGTMITHGSGAGQLLYGASSFTTPATVGTTHSFTISRGFTNSTGSTINITEVGIYTLGAVNPTSYSFLTDRTLMSMSIVNGATGTLTYTIQISI